jgi:hypothetical protein
VDDGAGWVISDSSATPSFFLSLPSPEALRVRFHRPIAALRTENGAERVAIAMLIGQKLGVVLRFEDGGNDSHGLRDDRKEG